MGKLRIVIADDNERMLQLLEDIIRTDKDMEVVGKAENGEICLSLVRELQPDVVLLDIVMPKLDGHCYGKNTFRFTNKEEAGFYNYNSYWPGGNYGGCVQSWSQLLHNETV